MAKQDASKSNEKNCDYNEWNPTSIPVPNTSGYPEKGVKTSGIKQRGAGAATKGVTARGPMA